MTTPQEPPRSQNSAPATEPLQEARPPVTEYTDDQIERAIHFALQKQDIDAVPGLIALLALQNPCRAESIRQTILRGAASAAAAGAGR